MSDVVETVKQDPDFTCMRMVAVDRRSNSWRTIAGSVFLRRRANPRRTEDSNSAQYVDLHEPRLFFVAVGALLLCVADAFFTMMLLDFYGSYELNPVMNHFIQQDFHQFFFVKFGLTAFGILFLVLHKNFRILNVISGYQILYASLMVYTVLIAYELTMLAVIPFLKHFF
jgi:hypothetical protein